jgi:Flp pilus assembly protein TadG
MNLLRRLRRGQRGSVAVEFALCLPIFLLLLFAVMEMGSAWYYKQMLVSASREGARMASLLNDTSNGSSQVVTTVKNYLTQSGFPGTPSVTVSGADGAAGTTVQVTATSPYHMPVLGRMVSSTFASMTLSGTTVMRHE